MKESEPNSKTQNRLSFNFRPKHMAKTNQLCKSKVQDIKETKKTVGSKIYENDSYLRAVVGNYRESGAMQLKKFQFFFYSTKRTFG